MWKPWGTFTKNIPIISKSSTDFFKLQILSNFSDIWASFNQFFYFLYFSLPSLFTEVIFFHNLICYSSGCGNAEIRSTTI